MAKFFTYEERLTLQKYLKESRSFKEIGHRIEKDPTTIYREVESTFLKLQHGCIVKN